MLTKSFWREKRKGRTRNIMLIPDTRVKCFKSLHSRRLVTSLAHALVVLWQALTLTRPDQGKGQNRLLWKQRLKKLRVYLYLTILNCLAIKSHRGAVKIWQTKRKQKKVHKVDFALIYSSQNSIIYGPTRRVIFPIRRTKPVNIGVSSSIMNFSLLPN